MRNRETLFKKKSEKDDRIKHPTFTTTNAIDRAYRFGVQVLTVSPRLASIVPKPQPTPPRNSPGDFFRHIYFRGRFCT